ncbi:MAG: haloalkane dehalogenase [Acidimicrobiales bacterium]
MDVLRTPDERFDHLADYGFTPHYREVVAADGTALRFHFVDEGPRDAAPVLLLHGNPSWSYLHRAMIRGLVERGHRAVALDLIGFGRSDKPAARSDYTLAAHVDWMSQWLEGEDLTDITLYCQDWGGITGLNLVRRHPDRFTRIVASNTGLPAGEGVNKFMEQWLAYSQSVDELPIAGLVDSGVTRALDDDEKAAYDAPFPDGSYQMGALQFPLLIPIQPDNPGVPMCRETWAMLETWTKPFLTVFGSEDAVAYKAGAHGKFQRVVPGAAGQPHRVIEGANHFIQEDAPDELVDIIDAFIAST